MSDTVTLRDTFAAAALSGLLGSREWPIDSGEASAYCYRVADAMLRERAKTIHDAAPAARAAPEPDAVQPNGEGLGTGDTHTRFHSAVMDWISEATVAYQTAHPNSSRIMAEACASCWDAFNRLAYPTTHSAPACDGADVLSTPDSGGPINRAAHGGQSPARSGESERRDVARPDTKGKVAGGPAHNTQEPVAWACVGDDEIVCDSQMYFTESVAERLARFDGNRVVPLYRQPQPTLTDAEREAVAAAIAYMQPVGNYDSSVQDTLRALLERTK